MKSQKFIFITPSNNKNKRTKYSRNIYQNLNRISTPIIFPESNIDVLFDNTINISNKKILVLSLVKNISGSVSFIDNFIDSLRNKFSHNVKFYFLSNNNTDDSINLFARLKYKYNPDLEISIIPNENITINNRIDLFAKYRNINFELAIKLFGEDFDNVIVFDSDLADNIQVDQIEQSLRVKSPAWSCISGNHCYEKSNYYYDELALRFLDDPIDIKEKFSNFDKYYGKSELWMENLFIINDWLNVKSAFGGISIYHMKELLNIHKEFETLYDMKKLPKFTAEHIALNLKLNNNILINPNLKYNNSISIEGKMHHRPIAFVPRDAGFFSVFNFYMGCLSLGIRAYPYFNKQALLHLNGGKNEHFCYWTQNDNCWFDYFEPVKFFDNDASHTTEEYKTFLKHKGEIAPVEFRIPKDTYALICDKERFSQWRKDIHSFYSQYIKYDSSIIDKVNSFWSSNINDKHKTIGIHYRHPSHFIESGKVYLDQYYSKIDEVLSKDPETQIFLATDSNFGLYAFMEKYGDKVKYINDVERLSMTEFLHWCFSLADGKADEVGFINGTGYELHHKRVKEPDNKKLTIDLLTEVLCLSKCDYLVHTTSNVALAISYINPDLELISL